MNNKAQFNFVWIFAIIAGGAILFLAIYGALKLGDTERYQADTEIAKKISILTDPLQAGFAEGSFGKIMFHSTTKINNFCDSKKFGKNKISVSTKSSIGKKWNPPGVEIPVTNKYIFSKNHSIGKEFYVFSKRFKFPYKVADLIFLSSENYCFINAPKEIKKEISSMNIPYIKTANCPENSIRVCFNSGSNCNIIVRGSCISNCKSTYDVGVVEKNNQVFRYIGNLMYAAIFSDKSIYECNVKRLLYRDYEIAGIFIEKLESMGSHGCDSNLGPDLAAFRNALKNTGSSDLTSLNTLAHTLDEKNKQEICGAW